MLAPYWVVYYVSDSSFKDTDLVCEERITNYCLGGRYIFIYLELGCEGGDWFPSAYS